MFRRAANATLAKVRAGYKQRKYVLDKRHGRESALVRA